MTKTFRISYFGFATKMGPRTRLCEESPRPLAEGTTWQSGGRGCVKSRPRRNIFILHRTRCKLAWSIVSCFDIRISNLHLQCEP